MGRPIDMFFNGLCIMDLSFSIAFLLRSIELASSDIAATTAVLEKQLIKDRLFRKDIRNWSEHDVYTWLMKVLELPHYASVCAVSVPFVSPTFARYSTTKNF